MIRVITEQGSNLKLRMEPQNALEAAHLKEMADQAGKGARTRLIAPQEQGGEFVIEVGQ
jgi:hypothetical protein